MLKRGDRLVVATHNPGKVREIGELLAPYGMQAVSAGELGISEPEETGSTFADNACLKARHSAEASGLPALADDSGLEVHALGGDPGIYSARWGGPAKDFKLAMKKVADLLAETGAVTPEERRANFTCALALAFPDGSCRIFEGKVFGHIVWPMRGTRGFGYDPIFVPDGHDITFGEMDPDQKHTMSHRARAFALFVAECLEAAG
jgi:XTP/dITP diphosphohydrolase